MHEFNYFHRTGTRTTRAATSHTAVGHQVDRGNGHRDRARPWRHRTLDQPFLEHFTDRTLSRVDTRLRQATIADVLTIDRASSGTSRIGRSTRPTRRFNSSAAATGSSSRSISRWMPRRERSGPPTAAAASCCPASSAARRTLHRRVCARAPVRAARHHRLPLEEDADRPSRHRGRALPLRRKPRAHRPAVSERWALGRPTHPARGLGEAGHHPPRRQRRAGLGLRLSVVDYVAGRLGRVGRPRLRRPAAVRGSCTRHRRGRECVERVWGACRQHRRPLLEALAAVPTQRPSGWSPAARLARAGSATFGAGVRRRRVIRARLLARSGTTLPRRRRPRWLARRAHRPVRDVRR